MKKGLVVVVIAAIVIAVAVVMMKNGGGKSGVMSTDVETAMMEYREKEVRVSGKIDRENTLPVKVGANQFGFRIKDHKGVTGEIVQQGAKPEGFDKAQYAVVTGHFPKEGVQLLASKVELMDSEP